MILFGAILCKVVYYLSGARPQLAVLARELRSMAAKWEPLMIQLGLECWQIQEISRDHPTAVRNKLEHALDVWLSNKIDASWVDVVYALQGIEQKVLANQIEAKYCPLLSSK